MLTCIHKTVPQEYQHIAEALFPPEGFCKDQGPSVEAAQAFARILGIESDYTRLLNMEVKSEKRHFLTHFQNNLCLLIQKTWVEQADEDRKEQLQNRIPDFIMRIEQGNYKKALGDFSVILGELAYLFFGAQSRKEDFTEYTFRIDTQMGLFFWYGQQLKQIPCCSKIQTCDETDCFKAVLWLGICYLTNF
jgi:hypothetical protein